MILNLRHICIKNRMGALPLKHLQSKVDIVVVYIHWGRELFLKPVPYQLQVTDHLLSLGVHLIIGSHSHVIQPHSIHGNRLVKFGLGNFFFPPARVPGGNDPVMYPFILRVL